MCAAAVTTGATAGGSARRLGRRVGARPCDILDVTPAWPRRPMLPLSPPGRSPWTFPTSPATTWPAPGCYHRHVGGSTPGWRGADHCRDQGLRQAGLLHRGHHLCRAPPAPRPGMLNL